MYYNITKVTGPIDFFQMVNDTLLKGFMGISLLAVIFIIVFISMRQRPPEEGFLGAIFITSMSSVFFSLFGIVPSVATVSLIVIMIISVFVLWRKQA